MLNSSVSGTMGLAGESHYGAAKAGLIHLAKVLALELAPPRIRVNCVSPGSHETPMWPDDHPQKKLLKIVHPLGRLGKPEELAAMFHFLAADDCGFITGENLMVDGGLMAGYSMQMLEALAALKSPAKVAKVPSTASIIILRPNISVWVVWMTKVG